MSRMSTAQTTRDYVVVVYPIQKIKWVTGVRTFVGPSRFDPDAMTMTITPIVPGSEHAGRP